MPKPQKQLKTDGRPAIGDAAAGHADAEAVFVGDFLRRRLRSLRFQIDANNVRAFLHEPMGDFLADAGASADDDVHLARQFFFRRHAAELRFFEQPILDVESFLLRQGDILVDGFRAAHDFDGAVVKLGNHARFALVLAERNHAEAGDEDDRRVRVAHGGRVGVFALRVIRGVILAVLFETGYQFLLQCG